MTGSRDDGLRGYNRSMVTLTEIAAERVKALAAEDPEARVLRLAVEGGGCSGSSTRSGSTPTARTTTSRSTPTASGSSSTRSASRTCRARRSTTTTA